MIPCGPGPEAAKQVPSTIFHRWDDILMFVSFALFVPYIVLTSLPQQFNLCFINLLNIFPEERQGAVASSVTVAEHPTSSVMNLRFMDGA